MTTTAILSSKADYTSFSFGGTTIRFLAPRSLVRYTSVKKWHEGYLEVGADYGHGEESEVQAREIADTEGTTSAREAPVGKWFAIRR